MTTFVMSKFSFSQSVFKRLVLQTCKNQHLFGKGFKSHLTAQGSYTLKQQKHKMKKKPQRLDYGFCAQVKLLTEVTVNY